MGVFFERWEKREGALLRDERGLIALGGSNAIWVTRAGLHILPSLQSGRRSALGGKSGPATLFFFSGCAPFTMIS
jgi:hypothetical protein